MVVNTFILNNIVIPRSIQSNCKLSVTGLGGTFLEFWSNNKGGIMTMNSKVMFSIYFVDSDKYNRPCNLWGMDFNRQRGLSLIGVKPLRGVKKPIKPIKIIQKVNKYLADNERALFSAIEN